MSASLCMFAGLYAIILFCNEAVQVEKKQLQFSALPFLYIPFESSKLRTSSWVSHSFQFSFCVLKRNKLTSTGSRAIHIRGPDLVHWIRPLVCIALGKREKEKGTFFPLGTRGILALLGWSYLFSPSKQLHILINGLMAVFHPSGKTTNHIKFVL